MANQTQPDSERGPIYGVPLEDVLPVPGCCMRQQLPSREDLEGVRDYRQGQRVVAGYEVLLWHWRRQAGIINCLADSLAHLTGQTVPYERKQAERRVDMDDGETTNG